MPLHGELERPGVGRVDRLDDSVECAGFGDQPLAESIDALGVERVHTQLVSAEDRGLAPGDPDRNDRDTQLVRLEVDVLFTPDLVLSNFIQYDNRSDNVGVNSRFRYILRDGREFFIVANQNVDIGNDRPNLARSEFLVKDVWTFTF